ncbi:ATP-dependent DNA helicase RecG, partial [Clostridium sp.]|uniref:ATP-dependent DNA helicase RecG n=1 Tax=Clostridium sp. TaxID=1506 RepID=UPI00346393C0
AKERLKFQELFTYSVKILMLKKHIKGNRRGIEFKISEELVLLKEKLPFSLTKAQSRVMREILIDEKKSSPMNRLVQGDVGSGKTIIAIIAIFNVIKNGYQGVFMAPTEILANQHYLEIIKVLNGFNVEVELLTGSTKGKEKLRIKERIKNGDPIIVVGTHALIEDDVEFKKLGMIITDEQHRFGVHQRSRLMNKNEEADVLVMTATPIPRTLSLYLYSDLDISIIDELPPGRQKIDTVFYNEENRNLGYELALEEIKKGRQVYIVCPLIEENEDLKIKSVEETYEYLVEGLLKGISIEILHGRMKPKEKDEIMKRFKDGETKVLISTTVIEVGVNVPNASVMIIENAERFGLSQLHQLRGRVGRGEYKSYCILIAKANNNVTKKRMQIMTMSSDGFYIAEQDLKIRGGGELFGFRQHGDNGLILSDFVEDIDILKAANKDAKLVVESDNMENLNVCKEIMNSLENTTKYICFN